MFHAGTWYKCLVQVLSLCVTAAIVVISVIIANNTDTNMGGIGLMELDTLGTAYQ